MLMLRVCVIVTCILIDVYNCEYKQECGKNCILDDRNTLICTDVPYCVPNGIVNVEVNDSSSSLVRISSFNFTGKNWDKVLTLRIVDTPLSGAKTWILYDATFVALKSVIELHLNVKYLVSGQNSFEGLSTVKQLDFTGSQNMTLTDLLTLLNGKDKLAGLQKIILSDWNQFGKPYDFDDKLIDVLLPRNITDIDVSNSHMNLLNVTTILARMKHLKSFNLSQASTLYLFSKDLKSDALKGREMLDISRWEVYNPVAILPVKYVFSNGKVDFTDHFNHTQTLFSCSNINATGVFRKPTALWVNNYTVVPTKSFHFFINELEFKENNLNRLDLRIQGGKKMTSDLEYLGLSDNNLEFLHYSILSCMPHLKRLDLSMNKMYKMYDEDSEQFGKLLSGNPELTEINLSNNSLTYIPRNLFTGCRVLTRIDLSYNELTQITFSLIDLKYLRTLDVRNNNIKTLNAESLHNLNSIPSSNSTNKPRIVNLASNPLHCSECPSKPFLVWLKSTKLVDIRAQGLHCMDENGQPAAIDDTTIATVESICIRKRIIVSVTVSITSVLTLTAIVLVWLYKRRTRENTRKHRRAVINKIRQGEGPYKFIVFFSYCSEDADFAVNNVLEHLKDNLRIVSGIDDARNPVCMGDEHLRAGFYVHDEIDACLDQTSAFIALITEKYCMSQYCGSELEKAFMKKKPIVLMFKGHVREDLMSRTMKDIFKRNVRVLWTEQNGEFVLQTTWDNVCTSIIDLIE